MGFCQSIIARIGENEDTLFDDIEHQYDKLFEDLLRDDLRSFRNRASRRRRSRDGRFFALCLHHRQRKTDLTCLETACVEGKTQFVEFLLRRGANSRRTDASRAYAPVHFAVSNGHSDVLRLLLRDPSTNPNCEASSMTTALHIAVTKEDFICARILLQHGASASIPNNRGLTAIHLAAVRGQAMKSKREMIRLLLTKTVTFPNIDAYLDWNEQTARNVISESMNVFPLLRETKNRPLTPSLSPSERTMWDLKYHFVRRDETNVREHLGKIETRHLLRIADYSLATAVENDWRECAFDILERLRGNLLNLKKAPLAAVSRRDPVVLRALLEADPGAIDARLLAQANDEFGIPSGIPNGKQRALECVRVILNVGNLSNLSNLPNDELVSRKERIYRWRVVRAGLFHGKNRLIEREGGCTCDL